MKMEAKVFSETTKPHAISTEEAVIFIATVVKISNLSLLHMYIGFRLRSFQET
jgi:hypothetical protein